MHDAIFFVNHVRKTNQLSLYNEQERFDQLVETLNSIHKHCPDNHIYIFDCTDEPPNQDYLDRLNDMGATNFYIGNEPDVRKYSRLGDRSVAESIAFLHFLIWFRKQNIKSNRIYKLSGRYKLNDNFIRDNEHFQNAFVFAKSPPSWMPIHRQRHFLIDRMHLVRFWHMDYNLLGTFHDTLPDIIHDCVKNDLDVEHAYYRNLHKHKTIELDKIGVCGYIAPTGEYIDE